MDRVKVSSAGVWAAAAALLGGWLWLDLRRPVTEPGEAPKVGAVLGLRTEDVTALAYRSTGRSLSLARSGDRWRLTEPIKAPADADAVKALLEELLEQPTEIVIERPTDLARYGLAPPNGEATLTARGNGITLRLGGPDPGKGSVYAREAATGRLLLLSNAAAASVRTKRALDLRSKRMVEADVEQVAGLAVTTPKLRWSARRAGDEWRYASPKAGMKADRFTVDDILFDTVADAAGVAAEAPADAGRFGLLRPEIRVEITLKNGKTGWLEVGGKAPGAARYARGSAGGGAVYTITAETFNRLSKDPGTAK
ncbi:MAG: DUF4340 domain-containing protein [Armatimonadetes bacterium]|nr:DUF4340 domain-containing protein [Armatimonadota bacterium]